MSYCRWSDGDVYFVATGRSFECYNCQLFRQKYDNIYGIEFGNSNGFKPSVANYKAALAHFEKHRAAGHTFPESAVERLKRELKALQESKRAKRRTGTNG